MLEVTATLTKHVV